MLSSMRAAATWLLMMIFAVPAAAKGGAGEIRNLLDAQVQAWNRGDLPGYMEGYWQSGELTFFSGSTVTKGWQQTLERYQARYQGEGKEMGRLAFRDVEVQELGADAAFARGVWELEMKDGRKTHGLFTLFLRKMPEGWRIVHDHSSAE